MNWGFGGFKMTEKRFTYMEQFNGFCDIYDNGKILSCIRLEYVENTVNLLNELNDKCEFLEIENESFEDAATRYVELYHKSLKENEELKTKVDFFKSFQKDARELEKENEQLKKSLERKQRRIDSYDNYIKTLKEDGVLDD